ncbi:MAG: glycosyltransferase [Saccharofermentans sp.]|nr:glycosyltransferase [Saccharofermentans sp.]
MSKISTIVISYNEKDYITRAIQSIVSQLSSGIELEIIIGDDGSNDGSLSIIQTIEKEYSSEDISFKHFVVDRPSPNEPIIPSFRVSSLIKRGLSMATGEYCVILSADDHFCDKCFFSRAINYLDSHTDYFSYVSGFIFSSEKACEHIPMVVSNFLFWAHYDYFHISCFVFRKIQPELLLERFCDDTGLVYSIINQGKCKSENYISFEYIQRDNGIMRSSKQCELIIIEVMIFQDILNDRNKKTRYIFASYSRFFGYIKELYNHREELNDPHYSHYLKSCSEYKNDIVGKMAKKTGCKRFIWFYSLYLRMALIHFPISFIWRITNFPKE